MSDHFVAGLGQVLLLPQRNTDDRFTSMTRHYLKVSFASRSASGAINDR
jgi:hypothetical protein